MKYNDFIDALDLGDAILFRGSDWISRAIMAFERNCHVGVYAGQEILLHQTYPTARQDNLKDYIKKQTVTVRRFKDLTDTEQGFIVAEAWKDVDNKRPYNVKGLVAGYSLFAVLRKIGIKAQHIVNPYSDKASRVCSSAYIDWATRAGVDAFRGIGYEQGTPDHILHSPEMSTVIKEERVYV